MTWSAIVREALARAGRRADQAAQGLLPASFAPVMAGGIVSRAAASLELRRLSDALLGMAVVAYAVLVVASVWRLSRHRHRVVRDAADPAKVFGFFTFVAASGVLATRLAGGRWAAVSVLLLASAVPVWLLLTRRAALTLRRVGAAGTVRAAEGSWFLCVVGLQSLVLAASAQNDQGAWRAAELAGWSTGVLLYGVTTGVVAARLLRFGISPRELSPPYWVAMGAGAISVLAGARFISYEPGAAAGWPTAAGAVAGVVTVVWTWAVGLVPVLVAAGVWRHGVRHVPLVSEPAWWTIVFPLGMFAVATETFGTAERADGLVAVGRALAWVALAAWTLVGAAALVRRSGRVRR
ncbi:tellurite resistance/C4-dicarboxylate transporter family protein [Streptomyces sp. NPDC096310]|uniref:tellurite resistance/C4-dicarboxylate transporter family protein n=1 Tax=Streptomyces sp. NPDC096310 TaxID=3366082 RepID=UPI003824507F